MAVHAIKLIQIYFTSTEILQLITSNFYSVLYYNLEIWHLPSLKHELKHQLLSVSAKALKTSQANPKLMQSIINIHHMCKRAIPHQVMEYQHSIILHKLYNNQIPTMDWVELNFHQTFTSREAFFNVIKSKETKIVKNLLTSKLAIINIHGIFKCTILSLKMYYFKLKLN